MHYVLAGLCPFNGLSNVKTRRRTNGEDILIIPSLLSLKLSRFFAVFANSLSQRLCIVVSKSLQRQDVASTLIQRCLDVMWPRVHVCIKTLLFQMQIKYCRKFESSINGLSYFLNTKLPCRYMTSKQGRINVAATCSGFIR